MTKVDDLLPCPFCGGEVEIEYDWRDPGGEYIRCAKCGATADSFDAWNTRAVVPGEVCEIEGTGEMGPLPLIEERTCALPETRIDHGSIEYNGVTSWRKCSSCGDEVLAYPARYCPNCGARVVDE